MSGPLDSLTDEQKERLAHVRARPPRMYENAAAPDQAGMTSRARKVRADGCTLRPGELRVLRVIADGHSDPAAAALLRLSIDTIKAHVKNMLDAVGDGLPVRSRTALAVHAVRKGWIE